MLSSMAISTVVRRARPDRLLRSGARRALTSTTCVATASPLVALTFDDGPDPRLTPGVLDVLRERGATATFLLVAQRVRENPELARRVVAEGHEIGLHGDRHIDLRGIPLAEQYRALRRGRRDIEAAVGGRLRWFRPPYGKQEPETVLACRSAGMRPLMWSTSAYDWKPLSLDEQLAHAADGLRPGAVVLLHDGSAREADPPPAPPRNQPELLDRLLDVLDERRLEPVSISRLCEAGRRVRAPWFEQWLHH
jgi:peptidoglycan/xylan/chitin deacetylase (PgdA/CDA1 family)